MTLPAPAYIHAPLVYWTTMGRTRTSTLYLTDPDDPEGDSLSISVMRSWDGHVLSADRLEYGPVTVHQLRALRDMIDWVLCEGPHSHVPAIAAVGSTS
jgi:hypothetical protein